MWLPGPNYFTLEDPWTSNSCIDPCQSELPKTESLFSHESPPNPLWLRSWLLSRVPSSLGVTRSTQLPCPSPPPPKEIKFGLEPSCSLNKPRFVFSGNLFSLFPRFEVLYIYLCHLFTPPISFLDMMTFSFNSPLGSIDSFRNLDTNELFLYVSLTLFGTKDMFFFIGLYLHIL